MILRAVNIFLIVLGAAFTFGNGEQVNYFGHKVLTIHPKCDKDLRILSNLRSDYGIDLWNEPRMANVPVMAHITPNLIEPIEKYLKMSNVSYETAIGDLGAMIMNERIQNSNPHPEQFATTFDFGVYHKYEEVLQFLQTIISSRPEIAKLEIVGNSYENRPIYNVKISSGFNATKPAIMMECGIHAREWSSVAFGVFFINELITKYGTDPNINAILNQYEINIVPEANPDGYIYSWTTDRLWRKTRSRSRVDWLGVCKGVDANRNFDIEHCGVGTSRKPCEDIFCGDEPFSESESRALRDLAIRLSSRLKAYFSIHAFSQLWMTPYGIKKSYPPNYNELMRVGNIGAQALSRRFGTSYKVGSIANIIYEAAGSSVDYFYLKQGINMAFALELRDTGRYGFILPKELILPTCQETSDGIQAAILALK